MAFDWDTLRARKTKEQSTVQTLVNSQLRHLSARLKSCQKLKRCVDRDRFTSG